jgi:ubiquinone/menaquinone biosynthesis C-methylase UbiE
VRRPRSRTLARTRNVSASPTLLARFYPDGRRNGTLFFYGWMRRELPAPFRLLNLGAGPGDRLQSPGFPLRDMRSAGGWVDGCDPDAAVMQNHQVDAAVVMNDPETIPFEDCTFDAVCADYVLEHVEHPRSVLTEVVRVLKPGGRFFFRTPNTRHYVSALSRFTPHWVHQHVANRARNLGASAHDPYPTFYRMNTGRSLSRLCRESGFRELELVFFEGEPSYLQFSLLTFMAGVAYERLVNAHARLAFLRANIIGKAVK